VAIDPKHSFSCDVFSDFIGNVGMNAFLDAFLKTNTVEFNDEIKNNL